MTVFYERCPCGAEFRVEDESLNAARNDIARWRTEHRHERPGIGSGDITTESHGVGFDAGRYGRIEEVV